MRLVALIALVAACNGDAGRFGVDVVSDGEGDPNDTPLFYAHPDVLPGVDIGWVEVDGRQLLRMNAGELTDHTLYDIADDGSVYLAGLEQAPLDVPALWVPAQVRHHAEWYQPELDRTVYVERDYAPGEWVFQYAVAGMAPEVRTRVEDPEPQGLYEAAPQAWSSAEIPWTSLGTVGIQPATGNGSLFVADDKGVIRAVDMRSGAVLWKQDKLYGRRLTGTAVQDGHVVVGDYEGYLHWLDVADGSIVARKRHDWDGFAGTAVSYDGVLHVLSYDGKLAAYQLEER